MDPDQHGKLLLGRFGGRLDIQVQAVFGHLRSRGAGPGARLLGRHSCSLGRDKDTLPCFLGHRGLPPELPFRRLGERNAHEGADSVLHLALDLALLHLDQSQRFRSVGLVGATVGDTALDVFDQRLGRERRAGNRIELDALRLFQRLAGQAVKQTAFHHRLQIAGTFPVGKHLDPGDDAFMDGDFHRRGTVEADDVGRQVRRVDLEGVGTLGDRPATGSGSAQ